MIINPDQICYKYSDKGVSININLLEGNERVFCVSGDSISLKFLGELFIAVSMDDEHSKKQIFPDGPGSVFFDKDSKFGIYINRL